LYCFDFFLQKVIKLDLEEKFTVIIVPSFMYIVQSQITTARGGGLIFVCPRRCAVTG
jgi:hypothetical protein